MRSNPEYISRKGYEAITKKIKDLKSSGSEILKLINLSRQQETGDESENAELMRLISESNTIAGKEHELVVYCHSCIIINLDDQIEDGKVRFGKKVQIIETGSGKESTYQILGAKEADPEHNTISYKSPLGAALVGREAGDVIDVSTPKGFKEYQLIKVIEK